jgi:hypothetical protein
MLLPVFARWPEPSVVEISHAKRQNAMKQFMHEIHNFFNHPSNIEKEAFSTSPAAVATTGTRETAYFRMRSFFSLTLYSLSNTMSTMLHFLYRFIISRARLNFYTMNLLSHQRLLTERDEEERE